MTHPRRTGLRRLWYVASWRCRYWYLDTREGLAARIVLALAFGAAGVWSLVRSVYAYQEPPQFPMHHAIADWAVYAIMFVVSLLISYALAPKPQGAKAQKVEVARVEDGATLRRIYGPVWITDPVVIGDKPMGTVPIRKKAGKSITLKTKWQTVGHWYLRIFQFILCRGRIDAALAFRAGDKEAWSGELTASGIINIAKKNLWGGEDGEGGLEGALEFMFGDADQEPNAYLAANLAPEQSAFRGRTTATWRGGIWGNSPYFKSPAFLVSRIHEGWDNDECWYPEKAAVPLYGGFVEMLGDGWEYVIQTFSEPNSGWNDFTVPTAGWQPGGELPYTTSGTWSPMRSNIWLRRKMRVNAVGLTLNIGADNGCVVWVNGEEVGSSNPTNVPISNNQNNPVSFTFGATGLVEVVVKAFAEISAGNDSGNVVDLSFSGTPLFGMNVAHVMYDTLTAREMDGEPVALVPDSDWRAAADRLYAEGFGIGTEFVASDETIEKLQQRLCDLVGAQLSRDPTTGMWHFDLIRDDIGIDDLPVLTDDDILEFERQPAVLDEAVNQVVVEWFDPLKKENRSTAPLQALGAIQAFGAVNGEVRTFREILVESLALRVAARDLRARSTPLERLTATTTRVPYSWRKGRKFRLQAPKKGIADMVCVLGDVDRGTLRSGAMRITMVQDVASMPATTYVVGEPGVDTGAPGQATPPPAQAAFELPYSELVQILSDAELAYLSAGAGYLAAVATDPGGAIDYQLWTREGAADYTEAREGVWCPTATVMEACTAADPDGGLLRTSFTLANGQGLSEVAVGSVGRWGVEEVRVDAIDPVTGAVEFGRGCADAVPAPHAAGERVWFYSEDATVDPTEYQSGASVQAKALTRTGSDQLQLGAATAMTVAMGSRAARPYPPGQFKINGEYYPAAASGPTPMAITWVGRNRITQGGSLIESTAAGVADEAGTSWTMRGYLDGLLVETQAGVTAPPITWLPSSSGDVRVELESVRDGLASWQAHAHTLTWTATLPDHLMAQNILTKCRHWWPLGSYSYDNFYRDPHGGMDLRAASNGAPTNGGSAIRSGGGASTSFTGNAGAFAHGKPAWMIKSYDISFVAWINSTASVAGTARLLLREIGNTDAESPGTNLTFSVTTGTAANPQNMGLVWEYGPGTDYAPAEAIGALAGGAASMVGYSRTTATTSVSYHVNGTLALSTTYTDPPTGGDSYRSKLMIGNRPDVAQDATTTAGPQPAVAAMQDVALFQPPLNSDEMAWLYNGGAGRNYADLWTISTLTRLWTPAQLGRKVVWVVSDDPYNTVDSGLLTHFNNRAGFMPGVRYSASPTYSGKHGTQTLNGRPVVTGDATNQASFIFPNTQYDRFRSVNGISIMAVAKRNTAVATSAADTILMVPRETSNGFLAGLSHYGGVGTGTNFRQGGRRLSADAFTGACSTTDVGTNWAVVGGCNNYATGEAFIRENGQVTTSNPTAFSTGATSNTTNRVAPCGLGISGWGTEPNNSYAIAEGIIIDGLLTTDEWEKLEGYLAHQWGLAGSLPGGHPYKSAPPTI